MIDFSRTVYRLVCTDLVKLSRYWVALAGFGAIVLIALPGAVGAHYAQQLVRLVPGSGYDFAINVMVRFVDLCAPILYVILCILFAIDVTNSTIKYILTRPVTRMELLVSKYATALLLVVVAVGLLWGAVLSVGAWFYDFGALRENEYVVFEAPYVWRQMAIATLFLLLGFAAHASLAVMVSAFSSTMGGAVIIGLILYLLLGALALVPADVGLSISIAGEEVSLSLQALSFPAQLYEPIVRLDDLATGAPIESWWTPEIRRFTVVNAGAFLLFFAIAARHVQRRDFAL